MLGLLTGCARIPADPAETLDRVKERGTIRLGHVSGVEPDQAAEATLARLSARTSAKVVRSSGSGEDLLERLETDNLDLVYGEFADDSPWAQQVYFGTPPAGPDDVPPSMRVPRFAFRPGENGWITAVEEAQQ
ncbi:hypothetical protein [Qipengyuania sp.]|uniref:hypothetical protein n=1 Tax=Qipengyuania sp. TaxID=2004515 RepID=UPI0037364F84